MSIEVVDYYRAVCDACGEDITAAGGDYSAWSCRDGAVEDARYADAVVVGDLVVCRDCVSKHRRGFDDGEWDALADQTPEAIARLQAWADAALAATASAPPERPDKAPTDRKDASASTERRSTS